MSNTELHPTSPPPPPACVEAREAFALELAGGPVPPAPVRAHVAACRGCADAVARIEEVWSVPASAFPRPALAHDSLEHLLAGALERAGREASPAPAIRIDAPRPAPTRDRRRPALAAAVGFALATSLVAVAVLAPGPGRERTDTVAAASPVPTGTPGVTLAAAKGDVSFVPADGSVLAQLRVGDPLPPGLFAASGGAALAIEGAGTLAVRGDSTVLIAGTERAPVVTIARGEIFVDLPKGTIRSFFVNTPTGRVRVTGTRFGVKVGPAETTVEVVHGTVVVSGPEGETTVEAGQAADLKAGSAPGLVPPADPAGDPRGWVRDVAPALVGPRPPVAISMRKTAPLADGSPDEETHEVSGLDKIAIENAMNRRDASLRRCYELALVGEPELVVRAQVTFRVDEDGTAEDIRVDGLPAKHATMSACLVEATKAAVFPGAAPGTEVRVRYPIQFVPNE